MLWFYVEKCAATAPVLDFQNFSSAPLVYISYLKRQVVGATVKSVELAYSNNQFGQNEKR